MTERVSFFLMPENALKSLKDELEICMGEEEARKTLERYGYRCGEELVEKIEVSGKTIKELADMLDELWAEVGLGKLYSREISGDELIVEFKEEVASGACSFVSGYLNGIADRITGEKFRCSEEKCKFKGDESCKFVITPTHARVVLRPERGAKTPRKHVLESGAAYIIKEETPVKSYDFFVDLVTHGTEGFVITRDYPEKIKEKYNLTTVPIVWLTNIERDDAINPAELSKLYYEIVNALKKSKKNIVIILSGLEYLISQNDFKSVLRFLQLVRDQIIVHNSILLLPVSPMTFEEKELKIIEGELSIL